MVWEITNEKLSVENSTAKAPPFYAEFSLNYYLIIADVDNF